MDDFEKRERNAGMFLAGNDTMSGRASIQSKIGAAEETATRGSFGTQGKIAERGKFGTQGRLAGEPLAQRDSEDGVETIEIKPETLGGGGLAGIEIIWADQTIEFIEAADLTDTYDDEAYWSLVLTVSSGSFDKTLAYDSTADIFTTTGTAPNEVQTKYRLRLITQYTNGDGDDVSTGISAYGQYREVRLCINGSPRQSLIKVT